MKRWPLNKAQFWETAPFFRMLLPLAVGILCYDLCQPMIPGTCYLTINATLILLYAGLIYTKQDTKLRTPIFVLLQAIFLFSGISVSYFSDVKHNKTWFGNSNGSKNCYLARVTGLLAEKEHSWKVPVMLTDIVRDGKVSPVTGDAFVYFYKERLPMMLQKGDSILLPGKWQPMSNAGNPFEFDYSRYCRRNNLYYQQFCSLKDARYYATRCVEAMPIVERCHDWCMGQMDKYITDPKTKGLIQAMLLGDEVNLDEDLRQAYAETGIIHIIAISGGNVATFFVVISFLMWWLKDRKHLWIKYAVALPLVWFYVLMAGAPPSAVRAAAMFSLVAFSVVLQKNSSSLNTLFATAVLLLCAQPMWLFAVGFQLSFVAVLSLVLFYKPVYQLFSPAHLVTKWLWSAVAASLAAEILTAPLVIYYFHNFPVLFIVANVVAFLFMGLVLVLGLAIVIFSFVPTLATLTGLFTTMLVTVFDLIINWLRGFNPASFQYLNLHGIELASLYIVIAGMALFFIKQDKNALFTSLVAACALMLSFCNNEWRSLQQQRIVVYNTSKVNHVELVRGKRYAVLNTDTSFAKKTEYAVKPAHVNWQAWKKGNFVINEIYRIRNKTFLLLNEQIKTGHFPVDYLIVNYTGNIDPAQLKQVFSPSVIVIGNNYTRKQQDKLAKECAEAGIAIHTVAKDGAFVME